MSFALYPVVRGALFRLDAERAHRAALSAAALAEAIVERFPQLAGSRTPPGIRRRLLGLDFPSPIGLAAGFDKDGVAPHLWAALGFGFAEIGTVTGRPQPGNPRPRLFRLAADRAVVNRLGFNSAGSAVVAAGLARRLARRPAIPIGINVGCTRAAMGDAESEIADLCASVRALAPLADYLALNVSSPNTPGLRDLQAPERLARVVGALCTAMSAPSPPLLVKLSPDLPDEAIGEICAAGLAAGAAGFIAGNTTLARPGCTSPEQSEAGGLSGAPLRRRATELVGLVRRACGAGVPLIGVGGVMRIEDVCEKLDAGADLIALYTGLIYEGPLLAARLARELARAGTPRA